MKLYYDENSCQLAVVIQLGNDKFLRTTSTELQPIFLKKGRAFPKSLKTLSFIFFFFQTSVKEQNRITFSSK